MNCFAQKLPNVQQGGLYAPAKVAIDGKTDDWGNKFRAYNHATDIYYTIANSDARLYLIVQATDPAVINKIIGGGITFTIQPVGKKSDKGGMNITYPLFDKKNKPYVHSSQVYGNSILTVSGNDVTIMPRSNVEGGPTGHVADPKEFQGDSIMRIYNKRLADYSKYIAVNGIKGIDSLISVYNTDGIRVAELFDNKINYTYEMAIDLKLLGLTTNKFAYHITINGSSLFQLPDAAFKPAQGDANVKTTAPEGNGNLRIVSMMGQQAATDFWGEYTLVKNN